MLSASASRDDLAELVLLLETNSSNYNSGLDPDAVVVPICQTDFDFSDIQIAYGDDIGSITVSDDDVQTNGVFNIPIGIQDGDNFYFQV